MKFVLAFCLVLSVATADWTVPTADQVDLFRKECLESESVSNDDQKKLKVGQYPNDPSVRCYVRCYVTKNGVWDDNNGLNWERSIKALEVRKKTITREGFDKCTSKNGEDLDACTRAYKAHTCLLDYVIPLKTD